MRGARIVGTGQFGGRTEGAASMAQRDAPPLSGYRPIGATLAQRADPDSPRDWRFAAGDGTRAEVALLAADLARVRLLPPGCVPAPSRAVVRAGAELLP